MNVSLFVGRVVRDVELKTTQGGTCYTKNAIAVDTGFGENRKTHFFNFTIWGKRAEAFAKYVAKGNRIELECQAEQNEYTNRDNVKVSTVDFRVNNWEFAQSKNEGNEGNTSAPAQNSAPASAPQSSNDDFMNIADGIDEETELPFN